MCPCTVQNVKVMKSQTSVGQHPSRLSLGSQVSIQNSECESGEKQARVNGRSNHVSTSFDVAVWLECTINRVSDGERSTLLSFVSCGASQGYAPQRGEIIGILTVVFGYVGIGTRLALTSLGWLTVREFVILVPDPIAFAPGPCELL